MNPAETQWSYDTMAPTPKLQYVIRDEYPSGFCWVPVTVASRRMTWMGSDWAIPHRARRGQGGL
jgi:hypothetical protein